MNKNNLLRWCLIGDIIYIIENISKKKCFLNNQKKCNDNREWIMIGNDWLVSIYTNWLNDDKAKYK